jgi:GT2 family glycosyltransferase
MVSRRDRDTTAGRGSPRRERAAGDVGGAPVSITAVILAHGRPRELGLVLDKLARLPVSEVLVAGDGSQEAAAAVAEHGEMARLIEPEPGVDLGIAGRNVAARQATGEFLLMLDDDSYPLPGCIETMVAAFRRQPRLAVVGGLVRQVDAGGLILSENEPGTFDWFLRAGTIGEAPGHGIPAIFFPEGACMIRREAFVEVGGFFEPYFLTLSELDLATRMVGCGWDVSYLPSAAFDHLKHEPPALDQTTQPEPTGLSSDHFKLKLRVRNQVWYFWMRYPTMLALRRIPVYLAYDLVECVYRGVPAAWLAGVRAAWRERDRVRHARSPLSRDLVRRAEQNRGRMHVRLLTATAKERWSRLGDVRRALT